MPRVKLNLPDGLIAVKKRIVRANKKKYAGTDKPMPMSTEQTQQVYNGVYERLNAIIAAMGEINAQLLLTAGINAPWASKAIDRYISATSSAKKSIADLNNYLDQNLSQLGSFTDAQITQLAASQDELTTTFKDIISSVNKLSPKKQLAIKKVFSVFVEDLEKLNQLLQGNIGFRKATKPLPVEALQPAATPHPEQEPESSPEKMRKKRSDAGKKRGPKTPQQPPAAGDSETSGGAYGDRIIGGSCCCLRRRCPMLFPAAEGAYLDTSEYMPTRFL